MGWIKLDRKLMENPLWTEKEPFDKRSAWIDLLMLANHKDHDVIFKGKIIRVKRGDVNRSILQLADRWQWSRGKVNRFLEMLEEADMCSVMSTASGTVITIKNYKIYQDYAKPQNTDDTTDDTIDGTTDSTTQSVEKYARNGKVRTTDGTADNTTDDTTDGHIQEGKEGYKKEDEESVKWLSNKLSDDDWTRLRNRYEDVIGLVDMVDNLVDEPKRINNAFRYILQVAEQRNWMRRLS